MRPRKPPNDTSEDTFGRLICERGRGNVVLRSGRNGLAMHRQHSGEPFAHRHPALVPLCRLDAATAHDNGASGESHILPSQSAVTAPVRCHDRFTEPEPGLGQQLEQGYPLSRQRPAFLSSSAERAYTVVWAVAPDKARGGAPSAPLVQMPSNAHPSGDCATLIMPGSLVSVQPRAP
jgi:hypothetical protein